MIRPGRVWAWLLGRFLAPEDRDAMLGDALEELQRRAARDGVRRARAWYRGQAIRSIGPAMHARLDSSFDPPPSFNRRGEGWGMWRNDLKLAARGLRRRPGFSLTIVATLAVGIGFTTALFGVYSAVFLEPLDLPDSEEIVVVMGVGPFGCCGPASGPDYLDFVERERSFDGMAALNPTFFNLTGLDQAERVYGTRTTGSAFDLLEVPPLLGRPILETDQDGARVAVLSHGLWLRLFEGRDDAIGDGLDIDGEPHEVVGVMPAGFDIPSPWGTLREHELFTPFPNELFERSRGSHGYPVIARLSDGVSVDVAETDMQRIARELEAEYPETNTDWGALVQTAHEYRYGESGSQFRTLLAAAALVLLIGCANVAGLLLARAAGREGELAVRTAIGASRRALARLLFAESVVLSAIAALGGVGVAYLAVGGLRSLLPPTVPRVDQIAVDGQVLVFAVAISVGTALLFGIVPALFASRTDVAARVRENGYSTLAPGRERLRDAFIVLQISVGLVLLNAAAVLVGSYANVRGQEHGFSTEGVLTMALSANGPEYGDRASVLRFYEDVIAEIEAIPGIRDVGFVTKLPLAGGSNGSIQRADEPPRTNQNDGPLVEVSSAHGDYFAAMGISLVRGRLLEPADSTPGAVGVLINERMAESVWPGEDPIGQQFGFESEPPWLTVVGVVGTVRQWGLEQEALNEAYFPYARGWSGSGHIVVSTEVDPATVSAEVRAAVGRVDPTQPPASLQTMAERVDRALAQRRFYTALIGIFAALALGLATAGIYGTVTYFVGRRVRELGIRMALGAGGSGIVGLVLRRGIRLAVWGVGFGLVGVVASTRVIESLVYGVGAAEVVTVLVGALALSAAAIGASVLPAARAARVSPVIALRSE